MAVRADNRAKLTYTGFCELPDDGLRLEMNATVDLALVWSRLLRYDCSMRFTNAAGSMIATATREPTDRM